MASVPCFDEPDILPWLYTELSSALKSPIPLQVLLVSFKPHQYEEPMLDPSLWEGLAALLANRKVLPELSSFTLQIQGTPMPKVISTAFKELGEPKVTGNR
jgi:hypothetical protein